MDQRTPMSGQPMTASDLIGELRKLPPDIPVLVRGYMGGFIDIHPPRVQKIKRDIHVDGYHGPHELDGGGEDAIVIGNFGRVV